MVTSTLVSKPLPHPPWRHQPRLIGRIMADPRPVLDELREGYGPIVGLGAGPLRMAIVGDPVALRELFGMPTESFRWGHRFNVLGFVVGHDSLIVSDGADWERRRGAIRAGFSRRRLNGWVDTIVRRTDARVDRLIEEELISGGAVVDLYPIGATLVQEIVVRAMFGERLASRASEIVGLFRSAQHYLESPFYRQLPHPLPLGHRGRVRADLKSLRSIVAEVPQGKQGAQRPSLT